VTGKELKKFGLGGIGEVAGVSNAQVYTKRNVTKNVVPHKKRHGVMWLTEFTFGFCLQQQTRTNYLNASKDTIGTVPGNFQTLSPLSLPINSLSSYSSSLHSPHPLSFLHSLLLRPSCLILTNAEAILDKV
jgi:hypothetical protein